MELNQSSENFTPVIQTNSEDITRWINMKTLGNLFGLLCILLSTSLFSQNKEIALNNDYSPFELMSSYYNNDFKPFAKKNWYVGFSMSLRKENLNNVDNLLQNILNGENDNYDLSIKLGHYLGNYSMLEINFDYENKKFEGHLLKGVDTIQSKSLLRGAAVSAHLRNSVPLTANERLSFFIKTGITFGNQNKASYQLKDIDAIERSFETTHRFRVGISPGITFFAMENFALEAGLDMLGYELVTSKNSINNSAGFSKTWHKVDFDINLLSIQLGLAYYFRGKNKQK